MSWSQPAQRPFLLVTPEILARTRTALELGLTLAVTALRNCEVLTRQALEMDLPVFNNSWFVGLKREDWERTWNDEWEYTWKLPGVLANPALGAALHYALTGAHASLQGVKRILQHALGFSFGASHFDVGLYYTFWCLPLLHAYDCIYEALTPQERAPIEAWFADYSQAVLKNDGLLVKEILGGKLNNHYAWHKWALGVYGLHSGDAGLVEYALDGPMGYREMITEGLRDEGLWLECSTGYNFSIHRPLTMLCWSLRNAGWPVDAFNQQFGLRRSLRDMYLAPLDWLFPDGSVPNVGDCYGREASLPTGEYTYAWAAYRDPRLAWAAQRGQREDEDFILGLVVNGLPEKMEPPRITSHTWPEHGYALLAANGDSGYFGGSSAACFTTFGYSGIHGHQDKLSFELYASGQRWVVDAEGEATSGNAFLSSIERELGRSTLAHNTVMVDQQSQRSIAANLPIEFSASGRRLKMTDAGGLYAGVRQERELQLQAAGFEDHFVLASESEHTYDYLLHLAAGSQVTAPLNMFSCPPFSERPYTWLHSVRSAELPTGQVSITAQRDGKELSLFLEAPAGSMLFIGESPHRDDYSDPPFILIMLRCRGRSAEYHSRITWDSSSAREITR
ncbi:MAG: heparinase II/III domain-containing protein [Anaerolineae bacterium]